MNKNDIVNITDTLQYYLDGLYYADSSILSQVFHADARYINTTVDDYMNYSMNEYFNIIDQRIAPAVSQQNRIEKIISIEVANQTMAFAKVFLTMMNRDYSDYLTLIWDQDRWKIISKVFSYIPKKEEN